MMKKTAATTILAAASICNTARAAVIEVTAIGFSIQSEVVCTASAKTVYRTLLHDVGKWWNPQHTYSGNSRDLSIDAKVGGCFCERTKGSQVEHARVIHLIPDALVRMSGALGPLQSSALVGTLSWKITSMASGSKIEMSYNVGGYMHGAFENIAPAVDEVLSDQLKRLKTFSETGKPQ